VVSRWTASSGRSTEIADAAEELADAGALDGDLAVCVFECAFGVEGAFPPGDLGGEFRSVHSLLALLDGCGGRGSDEGSCIVVLAEERSGDIGSAADCLDGDRRVGALQLVDGVADAAEHLLDFARRAAVAAAV
jgi:hypothetical protein